MPGKRHHNDLAEKLNVKFKNEELLKTALRHKSISIETGDQHNERLEFLGDSIIGMVVSIWLYELHPHKPEGELAKTKAFLVSEPTLAEIAHKIDLPHYVEMSPSEDANGGRTRKSILSDALEAVIGAIYLDRGMKTASRIVKKLFKEPLAGFDAGNIQRDFKSTLQERIQARHRKTPDYHVVHEVGADHLKTFTVEVRLSDKVLGEGKGLSKKEAEQNAAKAALANVKGKF